MERVVHQEPQEYQELLAKLVLLVLLAKLVLLEQQDPKVRDSIG